MKASSAILASVMAVIATSAQIPEQARWEITFNQVEAAANLADLRGAATDAFEARLMERPWSFAGPLPFLRLARIDGTVRATPFLYWRPPGDLFPSRQPTGPDVVCRDRVCVLPIRLTEQLDWSDVIDRLASQDACPPANPGIVMACGDCDQIWIKTAVGDRYREQSCQAPAPRTLARDLLELMKRSAKAAQGNR